MKNEIYYHVQAPEPVVIEDYIISDKKEATSKWWSGLPLFRFGASNLKEWFDIATTQSDKNCEGAPQTMRSCPGVGDLFKQSYVVKAPVDMLIKIINYDPNDPNAYGWLISTPTMAISHDPHITAESHPPWQYMSANDTIYKDKVNIKLATYIWFSSKKRVQCAYFPPVYHVDNVEYDVMPGIITISDKMYVPFNINLMFPKEDKIYFIKAGQPIAYMTFLNTDKPVFKKTDKQPGLFRKYFMNSYNRQTFGKQ